jgi:DNA-binding MarR family transcriptional regulator
MVKGVATSERSSSGGVSLRGPISRLTTAFRDFRRMASSNAFSSRWLGEGSEALESGQYDVLDRLSERDTWRMGELAEVLHVDPSAVTRAVGSLERLGFVARAQDPADRRCILVWSTPKGRSRCELARSRGLHVWDEALVEFSEGVLDQFARLMERLTASFTSVVFGDSDRASPAEQTADRTARASRPGPLDADVMQGLLERLEQLEKHLAGRPGQERRAEELT